jgi:hypothetical protein
MKLDLQTRTTTTITITPTIDENRHLISKTVIQITIPKMTKTLLHPLVLMEPRDLDFDSHTHVIDVGNVRFDATRITHVDHAKLQKMNALSTLPLDDLRNRNQANKDRIVPPDSRDLIHQSKIKRR